MARSRGSRSTSGGLMGGRRPMGTRQSSTLAANPPRPVQTHTPPPPHSAAPAAPAQQPGLFGQMASTAAGVAVGSTIGHTLGAGITSLFSGGGSNTSEMQAVEQPPPPQQFLQENQRDTMGPCEMDARNFTRCLDENSGDLGPCNFYLQQLKACQEAARQY